MNIKKTFRRFINQVPYVRQLHKEISRLNALNFYPPGHYYSPIVNAGILRNRETEIWRNKENGFAAINLNTERQLALMKDLSVYYPEIPFKEEKQPDLRYYFNNTWFTYTDGIILYSFIRHFQPKQIIEIGSGFSSAVMLDVNEFFLDNKSRLVFIEPEPARLNSLLKKEDRKNCSVLENEVQAVPTDIFKELEQGDILFIDSSHVAKTGSDLNHILFTILPLLKKGVMIHFHDVFFPFEYPKEWVFEGRSWNEDYFLRAFLMYNSTFEILLFPDYLHQCYSEAFKQMPLSYKNFGGSFWIQKNE